MLVSSVGRILEFYRARNAEHPIERLYIIGDVTSVNGLAELIDGEFEQDVMVIESLRGVEIKNHSVLSDEIVANYLANIGAVINPMRINVVSDGKKGVKTSGEKMPWWLLALAAVLAGAMCGGVLFVYFTSKNENDSLKAQIAAIEDVGSLKQQYEQSQADLKAIQDWYETTKGANETLAKFIDKLEEVQPSAVAITNFTSNEGEVTLSCQSYGKPAVAQFIKELKSIPYVENVKIGYINESIADYSADDVFQITLKLKYDDPKKNDDEITEEEESEETGSDEDVQDANMEESSDNAEEPDDVSLNESIEGGGVSEDSSEGGVE